MKLGAWVKREIEEKRGTSVRDVLIKLQDKIKLEAGENGGETVSFVTLQSVEKGQRVSKYPKAKAIENATGGAVTVKELCE